MGATANVLFFTVSVEKVERLSVRPYGPRATPTVRWAGCMNNVRRAADE
jgi:hypothetical protein